MSVKEREVRQVGALLLGLGLLGCATLPPSGAVEAPVPPLHLELRFPAPRHVAATVPIPAEILNAATVSVIDTATNQTVTAAVSSSTGTFTVTFAPAFAPTSGATYYLEASKGWASQVPGREVARVRTIMRYVAGWTSLTNASTGGTSTLDVGTTALSVGAALHGASAAQLLALIGTYTPSATPGLGTYTPPASPVVSAPEYATLFQLVGASVLDGEDPLAWINLGGAGSTPARIISTTNPTP